MFRHTVLFLLRPETTAEERAQMLRGIDSLESTCPTVRAVDFGENVLGGGAGSYDVALHLDFDDADGYAAYYADPGHEHVAQFNASISVADRTARVDWYPPETGRGSFRHVTVYAGGEGAPRDDALAALADVPGVVSAVIGENAGTDERAWDRVLDVELEDLAAARALLECEAIVSGSTAHVTYRRRG